MTGELSAGPLPGRVGRVAVDALHVGLAGVVVEAVGEDPRALGQRALLGGLAAGDVDRPDPVRRCPRRAGCRRARVEGPADRPESSSPVARRMSMTLVASGGQRVDLELPATSPRASEISVSGIAHVRSALTSRAAWSGAALAGGHAGHAARRRLSGRGVVGDVDGGALLRVVAPGGLDSQQPVALGDAGVDVGAAVPRMRSSPGRVGLLRVGRDLRRHRMRRSQQGGHGRGDRGRGPQQAGATHVVPLDVSGHGFEWGTWPGKLLKMIPQKTRCR